MATVSSSTTSAAPAAPTAAAAAAPAQSQPSFNMWQYLFERRGYQFLGDPRPPEDQRKLLTKVYQVSNKTGELLKVKARLLMGNRGNLELLAKSVDKQRGEWLVQSRFPNDRRFAVIQDQLFFTASGVHAHFNDNTSILEVYPFIEGMDLYTALEALQKHQLSFAQITALGLQIGEILACLHREGIAHLDVKPENFIVTPEGIVGFDFETAKETNAPYSPRGTENYLPPEALSPSTTQLYNDKIDSFGYGIILFILAKGSFPFSTHEYAKQSISHKQLTRLISERIPPCSKALVPIIVGLLEHDPTKRSTVTQAVAQLRKLYTSTSAAPSTSGPSPASASGSGASSAPDVTVNGPGVVTVTGPGEESPSPLPIAIEVERANTV